MKVVQNLNIKQQKKYRELQIFRNFYSQKGTNSKDIRIWWEREEKAQKIYQTYFLETEISSK